MGFVVEEIPFREKVVSGWPGPVIGVGKGFRSSTSKRVTFK